MKLERTILTSTLLLFLGVFITFKTFHGSTGFSTGWPVSQTALQINGSSTGTAALLGPLCIVLGMLLLILSAVVALSNLQDHKHRT